MTQDDTRPSTEATAATPFVVPKPALTAAEFAERLAEIRRRRDDPEHIAYVKRGRIASEEYRRQVDEQARRRLDEENK